MININPAGPTVPIAPNHLQPAAPGIKPNQGGSAGDFGKIVGKYLESVDKQQGESHVAIQDLLSGKTADVNSVVAEVAKADMSFKLLVGVRNKIIEAYKQTMQMQI